MQARTPASPAQAPHAVRPEPPVNAGGQRGSGPSRITKCHPTVPSSSWIRVGIPRDNTNSKIAADFPWTDVRCSYVTHGLRRRVWGEEVLVGEAVGLDGGGDSGSACLSRVWPGLTRSHRGAARGTNQVGFRSRAMWRRSAVSEAAWSPSRTREDVVPCTRVVCVRLAVRAVVVARRWQRPNTVGEGYRSVKRG